MKDHIEISERDEFSTFKPNREELRALVRYWAGEYVDTDYFFFVYQQAGGEWRRKILSNARISAIADCIGEDVARKEYEQGIEEYRRHCNEKIWRMFVSGEEPARDAHGFPLPDAASNLRYHLAASLMIVRLTAKVYIGKAWRTMRHRLFQPAPRTKQRESLVSVPPIQIVDRSHETEFDEDFPY